jgi:hypothetical protein
MLAVDPADLISGGRGGRCGLSNGRYRIMIRQPLFHLPNGGDEITERSCRQNNVKNCSAY